MARSSPFGPDRLILSLVLALPGLWWLWQLASGATIAMDVAPPTGHAAILLTLIAVAIDPLIAVVGRWPPLGWLAARRRIVGLAAFGYALVHLAVYLIDMAELDAVLAEIGAPGIWTGWLALLLYLPLAITSNDAAMRRLGAGWKRVQRLVYPALALVALHWLWIHDGAGDMIVHYAPLVVLLALRPLVRRARRRNLSPSPR